MTSQESAELTEPGIGSLHDPAPLVSSDLASVVVPLLLVVLPIRRDQLYGTPLQTLQQRIGVVSCIGDYTPRLLPRPTFRTWDADLFERGFRKRNFCRRGTLQPNSQRKTLTVDQHYPLRSLAALGFTDRVAPFWTGATLPSRNVSSHFSRPFSSSAPKSARHASSHTPSSCHCFSLRQQVAGEGNSSGETATPLRSAGSIVSPRNRLYSTPRAVLGCPSCVAVRATKVQSTPTAHRLPASAASS